MLVVLLLMFLVSSALAPYSNESIMLEQFITNNFPICPRPVNYVSNEQIPEQYKFFPNEPRPDYSGDDEVLWNDSSLHSNYDEIPSYNKKIIEDSIQEDEIKNTELPPEEKPHKLRFNYAAEQCGGKILAASEDTNGVDNILSGSFDSYMLSNCGNENWVVIELCEEIVIDSIVLGNKEFFSSNFKEFVVFGSKK